MDTRSEIVDSSMDNNISKTRGNGIDNGSVSLDGTVDTRPIRRLRSMTLTEFREKLVMHFNIAYQKNEVQWPRRLKLYRPSRDASVQRRDD